MKQNRAARWDFNPTRAVKIALCIVAGTLLLARSSSGQNVFAAEISRPGARFGTINLLDGTFTQTGTLGGNTYNDIAQAANGTLFAIRSGQRLVTLDLTTGVNLSSRNLSVSGMESMAISSGGTIYGVTQTALYTINAVTGQATLIGNLNNALLSGNVQSMRFGADGNLYTTDAGANATFTDMFRINIATGAASLVGMLADVPDFTLANSGSMLYGVGTAAGAPTSNLIGVNLNTFVPGGTNPDGSTAVITYELLTGNFQTDFNISSSQTFVVLPEPSTLGLCLAGGMILVVIHRRRGR